jgi:hypothetical protein
MSNSFVCPDCSIDHEQPLEPAIGLGALCAECRLEAALRAGVEAQVRPLAA